MKTLKQATGWLIVMHLVPFLLLISNYFDTTKDKINNCFLVIGYGYIADLVTVALILIMYIAFKLIDSK